MRLQELEDLLSIDVWMYDDGPLSTRRLLIQHYDTFPRTDNLD